MCLVLVLFCGACVDDDNDCVWCVCADMNVVADVVCMIVMVVCV